MPEPTLKVTVDGSGAKQGVDDVCALLRKMRDEGDRTVSSMQTVGDSLKKLSDSSSGPEEVCALLRKMRTESEGLGTAMTNVAKAIGQAWSSLVSTIQTGNGNMAGSIANLRNNIASLGPAAQSSFMTLANSAVTAVASLSNVNTIAASTLATIRNGVSGIMGVASTFASIIKTLIPIDIFAGFATQLTDAIKRFQGFIGTMSIVTGSVAQARQELSFLFDLSTKWGIDIDTLTSSYSKFAAAARGTILEGNDVRKIFESVTMAASVMHLSVEDVRLVMFALQQMASKNTVSMEELRKQLAERFPGAVNLAAESLNLGIAAMQKMIREGKIMADDLLPKLAVAIEKAFKESSEYSKESMLAYINRLHTAWEKFLLIVAESGVMEAAINALRKMYELLSQASEKLAPQIGEVLTVMINKFSAFLDTLTAKDLEAFFSTIVTTLRLVGSLAGLVVSYLEKIAPTVKETIEQYTRFVDTIRRTDITLLERAVLSLLTLIGHAETGQNMIAFIDRVFSRGPQAAKQSADEMRRLEDEAEREHDDRLARMLGNEYDYYKKARENYELSVTNEALKLKQLEVLRQRVKDNETEQAKQRAILDDPTAGYRKWGEAYLKLATLTSEHATAVKEFEAQWKKVNQVLEDQATALSRLGAAVGIAKSEYEALGTAAEEKLMPAMREFIKFQASAIYKSMSPTQQAEARLMAEEASNWQRRTIQLKEEIKNTRELDTDLANLTAKYDALTASEKAKMDAVQEGNRATRDSSVAQLEAWIATEKTQKALAIMVLQTGKSRDELLSEARAAAAAADAQRDLTKSTLEDHAAREKQINGMMTEANALNRQAEQYRQQALEVGRTKSEMQELHSARNDERIATLEASLATSEYSQELTKEQEAMILLLIALKNNRDALLELSDAQRAAEFKNNWLKVIDQLGQRFDSFIKDVIDNGWRSAFKKLWADFVSWGLAAIAKLAAQQVLISIFPSLAGSLTNPLGAFGALFQAGNAANMATSSPIGGFLSSIFQSGASAYNTVTSGFPMLSSFLSGSPMYTAAGATAAMDALEMGAVFETAAEGAAALGETAGLAATGLESIGLVAAELVPVVGWVVAGGMLLNAIFGGRGGGPKYGGTGSSGVDIATGALGSGSLYHITSETQADSQMNRLAQSNASSFVQAYRGLGGQGGTGSYAFTNAYSMDPKGSSPSYTHFQVWKPGQATPVYQNLDAEAGRSQEELTAAIALESKRAIFAALQSTIGELPLYIENLFKGLDATKMSSDEIDNVLAVARGLRTAAENMSGFNDQISGLNSDQLNAVVTALGGIQSFSQKMDFLYKNFTTSADRAANAQQKLNKGFEVLGIEVPKDHAAFMQLVESLDLSKAADLALYTSLMDLAGVFVDVKGSADDAAQALQDEIDAKNKITKDSQSMWLSSFASQAEKDQGNWNKIHSTWTTYGGKIMEMTDGAFTSLPTTVQGWRDLRDVMYKTTEGAELFDMILSLVGQSFLDLNGTLSDTDELAAAAAAAIEDYNKIHAMERTYLSQIQQLGFDAIPTTIAEFDRFIVVLRAAGFNDLADTMETLRPTIIDVNKQTSILSGSLKELSLAAGQANVGFGTILNSAKDFRSFTKSSIESLLSADKSLSFGDRLSKRIVMMGENIAAAQNKLSNFNAWEMPGSGMYPGSEGSPAYEALKLAIKGLQSDNEAFVAEYTRFVSYKAQYGDEKAQALVELERWYDSQKKAFQGNAALLTEAQQLFDAQWTAIINGTADGVGGTLDELDKLRKGLLDFVTQLKLGNLSPLAPWQKLQLSGATFNDLLTKSFGGDQEAMGQLSSAAQDYLNIAREIFASSSAYTQIFTYVTDMLTALGSTTGPLPSDQVSTASILSSIAPVGSSISSQADVQSLEAKVEEMSETLSALMAQVVINTAQTAKVVESSVSTLSNKIDANTRS